MPAHGFQLPDLPAKSKANCCWLFSYGPANAESIAALGEEVAAGHDNWVVVPLWWRKRPRKMKKMVGSPARARRASA
jgi:hypothetical protein